MEMVVAVPAVPAEPGPSGTGDPTGVPFSRICTVPEGVNEPLAAVTMTSSRMSCEVLHVPTGEPTLTVTALAPNALAKSVKKGSNRKRARNLKSVLTGTHGIRALASKFFDSMSIPHRLIWPQTPQRSTEHKATRWQFSGTTPRPGRNPPRLNAFAGRHPAVHWGISQYLCVSFSCIVTPNPLGELRLSAASFAQHQMMQSR